MTQAAETSDKKADQGTLYVVLEFVPAKKQDMNTASSATTNTFAAWREHSRETARSDAQAIRQALEGNTDGGTFVAIPARSFKPVKVTPETKTTLKLEEAH